jgi:hypothetical protein
VEGGGWREKREERWRVGVKGEEGREREGGG